MSRRIGVVTVARSDYSLYYPILRRLQAEPALDLVLIVAASHLVPEHGLTVREIEADGFPIAERVEMLLAGDTPQAVSTSLGLGVMRFSEVFARLRPDLLLLLGDRFEMWAAAIAALPFKIPVAHIHGGEVTAGAMDDAIRHSITKLSHLHFVATERYGQRVQQLGEEPWRVFVVGSPAVDNLLAAPRLSREELQARLGVELEDTLLVTFHPETLAYEQVEQHISALLEALDAFDNEMIFTQPNADTGNRLILTRIREFVARRPRRYFFANLGRVLYPNLLRYVRAMVGNSSSGLIEAPTFKLPVVNIGNRQAGRIRARNVVDVGYDPAAIRAALQRVLSPQFRAALADLVNPYGEGRAAEAIVNVLKSVELGDRLVVKHFHDLDPCQGAL